MTGTHLPPGAVMLRFSNTLGVIFGAGMNTVWLAAASWGERNIDFQSVRPEGLQPADWGGQRRTSPLGTQAKGLCSAKRITQPCSLAAKCCNEMRSMRPGFQTSLISHYGDRWRNGQRLKAWPRPESFRGCVAASLRSERQLRDGFRKIDNGNF